MKRRTLLIVAALAALVFAVLFAYDSFTDQINNFIILQRYSNELMLARQGGGLPVAFERNDWWGRPVAYIRWADQFLLVSFGRHGTPDSANYHEMLKNDPQNKLDSSCFVPWRDTIFINGKVYQGCHK